MFLTDFILRKLEEHDRKAIIMDRDNITEYLQRYYLLWPDSVKRERKDITFNVMLHRFMRSDDPVFHSHPWNWYKTIILKGGYYQHTPWGTKWFGPGRVNHVDCENYRHVHDDIKWPLVPANLHWLEVPEPGATWTLFIRGKTTHGWGFVSDLRTGQLIPHQEYLDNSRR
ncbi:MAG: hypothetical protein ACREQ5_05685 [Candidatus Dormibacteria bacterium]